MRRTGLLVILAGFLLLTTSTASAGEWELLGQRKVNFKTDRDVITVTATEGIFTKIKLKVLYNAIELLDLKVYFGDGDVHDVAVRKVIAAGGETRVIDLPGAARVIKKVEFVYRSRGPRPGRATVMLFGKHPGVVEAEEATAPMDWELLGQRKVNFGIDRDIIPVTITEGMFSKIKLKVLHNGIELRDLKVFYANGGVQDITIRRWIGAGGETRVIDLTGDDRVIQKVQFIYQTKGRKPGRATVQLWGKH
jgi:hypothetical protein